MGIKEERKTEETERAPKVDRCAYVSDASSHLRVQDVDRLMIVAMQNDHLFLRFQ